MADGRISASKIISEFLLSTSLQHQPLNSDILSALHSCYHLASARLSRDGRALIPLTSGSAAELYITPMYSCVGDVDVMSYSNDELTIPAGQSPPTRLPVEFHCRVAVFEFVDSDFPGYVYLMESYGLTECTDDGRYNAVPCRRRYIGSERDETMHGPACLSTIQHEQRFVQRIDGLYYSTDRVYCVRCLSWPPQAADWPTRHRDNDWPDSATVDRVVSNGCDVVHVAHRLCRQDEWMNKYQWRLSFSRAEVVLLNSLMPEQQITYHMLRVFTKIERMADITDNSGLQISLFSNYNVKTLTLWTCELKPRSWWLDDLNLVRNCVELLHTLAVWLVDSRCPHYFIDNCNLLSDGNNPHCAQMVARRLLSVHESSLASWFVDVYVRRCAQLCPGSVSALFDDTSTIAKLCRAVSAVVEWKTDVAVVAPIADFISAQHSIVSNVFHCGLTLRSCLHFMRLLANTDQRLSVYFTAVRFLHVAYKTVGQSMNDEMLDVIAITCLQSNDARCCFKARHSSVLSLSQAAKLMKVVANNSRNTVQLIEIELSKAYLYRALRCADSNNDSIYCLANVYLAALYYTSGRYQTAIDHCTLVMKSENHSQCSSHAVQGELLPNIDADIDHVFGLTVFYQHVRTASLRLSQQRKRNASVASKELFATYLHNKCVSCVECRNFTQTSSADEIIRRTYESFLYKHKNMFTSDLLLCRFMSCVRQTVHARRPIVANHQTQPVIPRHLDTSELVELLQQSAVEHLTKFRRLEAQEFCSKWAIVTTDFESLYAYKRGNYERCLQLSTHNVHTLVGREAVSCIYSYPEFIQLMDDDIVSLTGLTLLIEPSCRDNPDHVSIQQQHLSLYLMIQCQMKLHHTVTSLTRTHRYIQIARRHPLCEPFTIGQLILKLAERKILSSIVR